jgi:hypothetical protein
MANVEKLFRQQANVHLTLRGHWVSGRFLKLGNPLMVTAPLSGTSLAPFQERLTNVTYLISTLAFLVCESCSGEGINDRNAGSGTRSLNRNRAALT